MGLTGRYFGLKYEQVTVLLSGAVQHQAKLLSAQACDIAALKEVISAQAKDIAALKELIVG